MQATIAQQLGLEVTTVANFFMNARRRSLDKWRDDDGNNNRESVSKTSWRTIYQYTKSHCFIEYLYIYMFHFLLGKNDWISEMWRNIISVDLPRNGSFCSRYLTLYSFFYEGLCHFFTSSREFPYLFQFCKCCPSPMTSRLSVWDNVLFFTVTKMAWWLYSETVSLKVNHSHLTRTPVEPCVFRMDWSVLYTCFRIIPFTGLDRVLRI